MHEADASCALQSVGLSKLVEYNKKKTAEKHIEELKANLEELITSDPPPPVPEIMAVVNARKKEQALPDTEVIKVCGLIDLHSLWVNRIANQPTATGSAAVSIFGRMLDRPRLLPTS